MYDLEDILTSDGKYKERKAEALLSKEIVASAIDLADRVTRLLTQYGSRPGVSSGFRTASANAGAGGARRSSHMSGQAVDLIDPDGKLDAWCMANLKLLERAGLYLEHPDSTKTWCHLQTRRPGSGNRVFRP